MTVMRRHSLPPIFALRRAIDVSTLVSRATWRAWASQAQPATEIDDADACFVRCGTAAHTDDPAPVASPGPSSQRLLLRDFIQQSLYHPTRGYFNRETPVVGHLDIPINYWKVYCKEEWKMVVNKKYKELQVSFLTPVELFTPWYGYIIARHMLEHRKHILKQEGMPLVVYEVGGGNGTLARDVLDWLRDNRPDVYEQTTYTCVEISSRLAAQQYETVVMKAGHHNHFKMLRGNAWDRATWGQRAWGHCFILAMEVLDNLPHDRVVRKRQQDPWQQTVVKARGDAPMETGPWDEITEPVTDPLLKRSLDAVYIPPTFEQKLDAKFNKLLDFILAKEAKQDPDGEVLFVPTGSMAFLETLHDVRPNHSIIAADFDKLPDVKVLGRNAPLVAEKVDGKNIDHDTLYVPWGKADIFFPTDFDALGRLYRAAGHHVWGKGNGKVEAVHYHQGAVMKRYKEMAKTATICAFNPMIDDFLNARFFLGDSSMRQQPEASTTAADAVGSEYAAGSDNEPAQVQLGGSKWAVGGGGSVVVQSQTAAAAAAAAAAAEAIRLRQLRQQEQKQKQQASVQPDAAGLPPWAREKLRQRQQQALEKENQKQSLDQQPER